MNAICRLYQDGGCAGPNGTIETTPETAFDDAVAWAEKQIGHPWDGVTVTMDDGEAMDIRCDDGAWEAI